MRRHIRPLIILVLLWCVSSCGGVRVFSDLAPGDAEDLIRQYAGSSEFVILDVRTETEFTSEHLEDAINLDIQSAGFSNALEKLDKAKTYLVYCRSGGRSTRAMNMMKERGFTHVHNLLGGLTKWKAENRPLEIR